MHPVVQHKILQPITIAKDNEGVFFSEKDQKSSIVQKTQEFLFLSSGMEGFIAITVMDYTK